MGIEETSSFGTNVAPDSNLEISNIPTTASADQQDVITIQRKELGLEDLLQEVKSES